MQILYKDWLTIARQLNLSLEATREVQERNPLDWYRLTESANGILNGLIAYASRERRKELNKANLDPLRVSELTALHDEVLAINNNTQNFKSMDRMEELINKYGPILKAANLE
jgi:hypothetical protein